MQKIKELQGKKIAIVGLGKSWFDFALARTNGTSFDEVWVINAVGNVIYHDRTTNQWRKGDVRKKPRADLYLRT